MTSSNVGRWYISCFRAWLRGQGSMQSLTVPSGFSVSTTWETQSACFVTRSITCSARLLVAFLYLVFDSLMQGYSQKAGWKGSTLDSRIYLQRCSALQCAYRLLEDLRVCIHVLLLGFQWCCHSCHSFICLLPWWPDRWPAQPCSQGQASGCQGQCQTLRAKSLWSWGSIVHC